jgi:hypothetical protein
MIKPTYLLILLAFSLFPTVVVGKAEDEAVLTLPSTPALRSSAAASASAAAEAARAPATPQEGQLQRDLQGAMLCFKAGEDGKPVPVPCGSVGHCDSYACCKSMSACFGLGQYMCGGDGASGFAIQHLKETTCPYKWSCCYTE